MTSLSHENTTTINLKIHQTFSETCYQLNLLRLDNCRLLSSILGFRKLTKKVMISLVEKNALNYV